MGGIQAMKLDSPFRPPSGTLASSGEEGVLRPCADEESLLEQLRQGFFFVADSGCLGLLALCPVTGAMGRRVSVRICLMLRNMEPQACRASLHPGSEGIPLLESSVCGCLEPVSTISFLQDCKNFKQILIFVLCQGKSENEDRAFRQNPDSRCRNELETSIHPVRLAPLHPVFLVQGGRFMRFLAGVP